MKPKGKLNKDKKSRAKKVSSYKADGCAQCVELIGLLKLERKKTKYAFLKGFKTAKGNP